MSGIYDDLVIPYVGPGFCCAVSCQFFAYEPFHKPIEGCKGYENFQKIEEIDRIFDPNFTLHYFMDFASNEKWKCYIKNCPIHWSEPFHCQGDQRCIQYPNFCAYFNIPFKSELNGFDTEGISVQNLSEEKLKRLPKVHIAENKGENTTNQNMKHSDSKFDKNYAQNKNFQTTSFSSVHTVCCKCHSQGAKCTNCRCKKSGNHCTNCLPMLNNKCCNQGSDISNIKADVSTSFLTQTTKSHDLVQSDTFSFVDQKMIEAFGAPLLNSDGKWSGDMWEIIWKRVVKLQGKLYTLPGGSIGRSFVSTLAAEVLELGKGKQKSELVICFPTLILQRNKEIVKTADIRRLISRRLKLWSEKRFFDLISEAELCDKKLPSKQIKMTDDKAVAIFTRLLLNGKIREATRFITERQESGGVMLPHEDAIKPSGKTVLEVLKMKHPEQAESHPDAFVECEELPVLIDVTVTETHVRKTAHKLSGSAGPSGADSNHWQAWLLKYGNHSKELRESVAILIERQANNILEWEEIRAQKAKREIALKKLPAGVRPIGCGELLDRLCDKVMVFVTEDDVKNSCNADQLCSGIQAGIEGAVHSIRELFDANCDNGYCLFLSDADNAFNSINRPAALWNARILWVRCSRFLFNSYRGFSILIIKGISEILLSKEGVTQGLPSAMKFYAIGLLPLTLKLKDSSEFVQSEWEMASNEFCFEDVSKIDHVKPTWKQWWYADDSSCGGNMHAVLFWIQLLFKEGPKHGYFPLPDKSYLVVAPTFMEQAKQLFSPYGINIVEGQRVLGGFIGSIKEGQSWANTKINSWDKSLKILSEVAKKQPQAAYVAVSKALQNEWNYLQRIFPNSEELFSPLRQTLFEEFLPALTGCPLTEIETQIIEKPTRMVGLGIRDPVTSAKYAFETSTRATSMLQESLVSGSAVDLDAYEKDLKTVTNERKFKRNEFDLLQTQYLIQSLSQEKSNKLKRLLDTKCSTWLSILPTNDNFFALSPDEFRDAVALRYQFTPKGLPSTCDGCSEDFDLCHALNCKKGGLVIARHNELRDLNCDLCSLAGLSQIISEPIVQESNEDDELEGLRADWSVRGFWDSQRTALFDVCIFNADACSLRNQSLQNVFQMKKNAKKSKYCQAAEARRASFTPIIASCEAIFDNEAEVYMKRLATILSKKWDSSYSRVLCYIRARMQICIIRSVSLCLRGSRTKWKGAGFVDHASIPINVLELD